MAVNRLTMLENFIQVVENGNFSSAAAVLGTTPSGVSKIISRLEDNLGVRLFDRTSRSVSLTPEGKNFVSGARQAVDAMRAVDTIAESLGNRPRGLLRIHTMLTLAKYQLAPMIPEFADLYPLMKLQFRLTPRFNHLDQDYDVAIFSGALPKRALVTRTLATSRWIICAAPSYIKKFGAPQAPKDLGEHRCLNFEPGNGWNSWHLRSDRKKFDIEPDSLLSADQGDLLLEFARYGMGIVRLAEFHVGDDVATGRLVRLLPDYEEHSREPIFAVFRSRRNLSPRIRAFLDFIQQRLKSSPWNDPRRRLG